MNRLSSSATLLLTLFFPTLWIVFFGAIVIAILFSTSSRAPILGNWMFKAGALAFYSCGLLFLRFTFLRLKRVEVDENYVYVTNYFRTFRYPYSSIEKMEELNYGIFVLVKIRLIQKGKFGKSLYFLESRRLMEKFLPMYPLLLEKFKSE